MSSYDNSYYYTPIHIAANFGQLEICQIILEDSFPKNKDGKTPFQLAADQGRQDILNLITSYTSNE